MAELPYTRHVAGELVNNMQHCVVCGMVLTDYRNAAYFGDGPPPKGWAPGEVYVRGNFYMSTPPLDEPIKDCTP